MKASGGRANGARAAARGAALLAFALLCGAAWAAGGRRPAAPAPPQGGRPSAPTYAKDVAPILNRNCVACHRAGDIAPMPLVSYADARTHARAVSRMVAARVMPPWHADPRYGEFANERRLTDAEIETVVRWAEAGAPEGDPKDLPPAPRFEDEWEIGRPDLVLSMPEEQVLGPEFTDNYLYFRIPTNFKEDRWVQSVEFRPGNRRVVHHAVAFIETPEAFAEAERLAPAGPDGARAWSLLDTQITSVELMDGTTRRVRPDAPVVDDGCAAPDPEQVGGRSSNDILSAYAPGRRADFWPEGAAKRVPAGSNIVFQMHYSKRRGATERDRTSVALKFARAPVERMVGTRSVSNNLFLIPAGAPDHEVTACWTYEREVELLSFMPHMHVRGKSMRYEAVYPSGRRETLLSVPRYSFHWQTLYTLRRPLRLPPGTRLVVTARFDNSPANHHNPDPGRAVRHGSATFDEMMIGFVNYTVPRPPDPRPVRLDPSLYDSYAGRYEFQPGAVLTVRRSGERLYAEAGGERVELVPLSEATFFSKGRDAQLTFVRGDSGEVTGFVATRGDRLVRFRRLKD